MNRALLVGVSEYDNTRPPHGVPGDLPAVKHNLNALREALRRGGVFEEREITLSRSPDQVAFDQALLTAAAEAEGVLLLYFSGHGAIPSAGDELFLQLRNASVVAGAEAVFPGAAMFSTVLAMLASSPARRIVVVLDCCFAGNAAWIWDRFEDRRRVLLLMSVQANHRIDAGDADTPTPFTEEMVRLLREGAARGREVTFQRLVDELPRRLAARGHRTLRGAPWEPQSHTEAGEDVLLVAGRGGDDDGTSEPPPRPGPWDRVRAAFAAVAGVLAGAVSGVLKALLRRLRGQGGAPPDRPGGASPDHPPGASADRSGGASPDHPSGGPRFVRRLLAWCAVLLAVAVLGVGAYRLVPDLIDGPASCAPPLELRVLTDPDLEPTLRAAADAYLTSEENTTGDGCRRSGITVYSAGAADTVTALRRQSGAWQEPRDEGTNPQRDVGPQPDVWIPGSRAEVARVVAGQDTDAVAELEAAEKPLAYSPVVLAVPQALAVEDLDERVGPSLNRMIDTLRSRHREAEVRRPDPEFTVTGLLATVGLHAPGPDAGNSPVPDHAGAERRVAQSGPPSRPPPTCCARCPTTTPPTTARPRWSPSSCCAAASAATPPGAPRAWPSTPATCPASSRSSSGSAGRAPTATRPAGTTPPAGSPRGCPATAGRRCSPGTASARRAAAGRCWTPRRSPRGCCGPRRRSPSPRAGRDGGGAHRLPGGQRARPGAVPAG